MPRICRQLAAVVDGYAGLEHELAAFPLGTNVVELMAQSGVAYTPTLIIAVGAHGNAPGLGTHWEIQAVETGGITPMEVLAAVTRDAAAAIGRQAEFGSIEAGKYADLVILARDPRQDIANTLSIAEVMKNGRLYDGDTLDELWPRRRAFPRAWFRDEDPEHALPPRGGPDQDAGDRP